MWSLVDFFHISTLGFSSSENAVMILRTFGRHMVTEFFWEIFPVDSFEDFPKCELREETFVAPNFWCCNVEFRSRWVSFRQKSERKKARTHSTAHRAEGDFSLVVSQCLDTFELLTEFYPTFHHLSFFFQIVPTFLESALEYSGYWKSLWKSWWFQLSGFNQSNPVSEFLLILGLPSLGVEQNWQPLSQL